MIKLEACVGDINGAVEAEKKGANRIELCSNLLEGGITPSHGIIKSAKKLLSIPINVMIRPRGGNFIYNQVEAEVMKNDIEECRKIGVKGIVVGVLNEELEIDKETLNYIIKDRGAMEVTFHMAFDELKNPYDAIDYLSSIGIDRILTRGGEGSAIENMENIKKYVEYSKNKIILMPGSGINKDNYKEYANYVKCQEIHGTKIV